jgi:hypothetical protein
MTSDPILREIRETRQRISAECGHDPRRLLEYYMKLQEQHRDRLAVDSEAEQQDRDRE